MTSSWAQLLERAGAEAFVGRRQECEAFTAFVDDDARCLLHVYGPAGIGKTSLLYQFVHLARSRGFQPLRLDGAALDDVAAAVERAFGPALTADADTRFLVLIDNFGELRSLHRWMRQHLLTKLPATVRLVTASRGPLPDEWLTAPGWERLLESLELEVLSESESLELLERRGVAPGRRGEVAAFGKGHPLALTVAADVVARHPDQRFCYETAAEDLQLLLRRLLGDAPSDEHRHALELSSLVRRTTEPLLAAVLEVDQAGDLLRWLAKRPFFDVDDHGFFPHDLVRRLLNDEMRRFEETRRTRMLRAATKFYTEQGDELGGDDYEQVIIDLAYMLRDDILSDWAPIEAQRFHLAQPDEEECVACLEAVRTHEGPRSAELAAHWQDRQPEGLVVLRDPHGELSGFCHFLDIERIDDEDARRDPAIEIARACLADSPLRAGETARICRYWMAIDTYQEWSGVQTRMFVHIFHQVAASAGVALGLTVHAHPKKWVDRPDNQLRPFGEFELDQIPYVVLGRDWRKVSKIGWLGAMAQAMMGKPRDFDEPTPTVLQYEEFEEAVKGALKNFHRGDRLESNPMVNAPLVLARCELPSDRAGRVAALRDLLEQTCQSLGESGGDLHHVEILERTYLTDSPKKQQAVAADLKMAYSTFRLHLAQAVQRVVDHLWAMEQAMVDV